MSPLILPAIALLVGACCGLAGPAAPRTLAAALAVALACAALAAWWQAPRTLRALVCAGALLAGAALAAHDRDRALHTPLRELLDRHVGGFALETLGPGGEHEPLLSRIRLREDAAWSDGFTSVRGELIDVRIEGEWRPASGGVAISVSGTVSEEDAENWTAGRVLEAPVAFRRPARYLNTGVTDVERDLSLAGTSLFGSVKSALLVTIVGRGSAAGEMAAKIRRGTRQVLGTWVGRHSTVSAAIVTAVLIGDRTGLPDDVRLRLQAAGTYHVIAISGGNIAIFAGLSFAVLMCAGFAPRTASLGAIALLVVYAQVVTAGPSVWRATTMAACYLAARVVDHRAGPWHTCALTAFLMVAIRPLDVSDAGFLLTFGATVALLEVARRVSPRQEVPVWRRWVVGAALASLAAEIALLPIAATAFSRVTCAGLILNFLAIPAMAAVQIAGMAVIACQSFPVLAAAAGWTAHAGATVLIESARLVEVVPWLSTRVPSPGAAVVAVYYTTLVGALAVRGRTPRVASLTGLALAAALMITGAGVPRLVPRNEPRPLSLTVFDVGQAESVLVEFPDESRMLVDTGGAPFGTGSFDIGARVLAPALWARGIRSLDTLLITHGDPDHAGGALAVMEDFEPAVLAEGLVVPSHSGTRVLRERSAAAGIGARQLRAGMSWRVGQARVRVLHPQEPDWERPRVRNDDSVVLEIVYHDVAVLLTGDIGAEVERTILPQLSSAAVRVLKVAHHGSRTSTSAEFLDVWPPQYALISAGRGNRFGHPAPQVIARLQQVGTRIYRTDLDGELRLTTDGHNVHVTTFTGRPNASTPAP